MPAEDVHDLARSLRPQEFGRTRPTAIDDPLVEPAWPGRRVIASVGDGRGVVWSDGEEFDERPEVTAALARAAGRAVREGAVFEGYLTKQIAPDGVGVQTSQEDYPSAGSSISRLLIGGRRDRIKEHEQLKEAERAALTFGEDDVVDLVIVDLLWLDGQWLLDVPLLERKRILESVLHAEPLVRPGAFVREPIGSWMGSWRAQGFRAMTFKAANSRYRPGQTAVDWTLVDIPRR